MSRKRQHRKARQALLKKSEIEALDAAEAAMEMPAPIVMAQVAPPPDSVATSPQEVERAAEPRSRQPRFQPPKKDSLGRGRYSALFDTYSKLWESMNCPERSADSRSRDRWMRKFVEGGAEPFLSSVISTVTMIDANRKYVITGGRNQVIRYAAILKGNGTYRERMIQMSRDFHTCDMQGVQEVVREVESGPLLALRPLDAACCRMTNNVNAPLAYSPPDGSGEQLWPETDFIRVATPTSDETLNGLGWCSVSRILEMAKLVFAVYMSDHEQLGSRQMRGLMLLKGITEDMWDESMKSREATMNSKEWRYYGALGILANPDGDIDAKLVALSQLPAQFDRKQFNEAMMDVYSMAVGYDVREFVSRGAGTWGAASETGAQQMGAMTKGGATFILGWRDQITRPDIWPQSLDLEIESRSDEADLLEAKVRQARAAYVTTLYNAGIQQGTPLLGGGTDVALAAERAMQLLESEGLIPEQWAQESEKVMSGDTSLERLLSNPFIVRAIEHDPEEPIVRYDSRKDRVEVVALRGGDLIERHSWNVERAAKKSRITQAMRKRAIQHWDTAMPGQAGVLQAQVQ